MIEGYFVRMKGLEPPCLAALDPKSSASTNSATSAGRIMKLNNLACKSIFMKFNKRSFIRYDLIGNRNPMSCRSKNGMQK